MGASPSNIRQAPSSYYRDAEDKIPGFNAEADKYGLSFSARISLSSTPIPYWREAIRAYADPSNRNNSDRCNMYDLLDRFVTLDFDNECDKYNLPECIRSQIMHLMRYRLKKIAEIREKIKEYEVFSKICEKNGIPYTCDTAPELSEIYGILAKINLVIKQAGENYQRSLVARYPTKPPVDKPSLISR